MLREVSCALGMGSRHAEDGPPAALGSRHQQEGVVALEEKSPVVSRARILKPGYP